MFVTLLTIIRLAGTTRARGLSRRLGTWCDAVAAHVLRRSAITSLSELDDRALRDIGLERSQIEAAVYGFVTVRGRGRR
jgi:uncharacterized protein YjiS (DUF1127 family)